MYEPCCCGALDCPRCYPSTYKDSRLYDFYEDEYPNHEITFKEFKRLMEDSGEY